MSSIGILIDSDDWLVLRAIELRAAGKKFQICVMVKNEKVIDEVIVRENGKTERRVGVQLMPGGWAAYCVHAADGDQGRP